MRGADMWSMPSWVLFSWKGFTAEAEPVGIVCLIDWISIVLVAWRIM